MNWNKTSSLVCRNSPDKLAPITSLLPSILKQDTGSSSYHFDDFEGSEDDDEESVK
jgi:hypothetical protein